MTVAVADYALSCPDHVPAECPPTADQKEAVEAMMTHFNAQDYALPVGEGSQEKAALTDTEKMYMSYETLLRFYIGQTRNGTAGTEKGLKDTIERLEATMVWRRTEGLNDIEAWGKEASDKRANGTVMTLGFGTTGMPIIYFLPNRDKRPVAERKVSGAFYMLDRALDLANHGINQTIVIFSFHGKREAALPTAGLTKDLIFGYSSHYPETLGRCLVLDMPWWARLIVNIVWPFIDPHTKEKVVFSGKEALDNGEIDPGMLLKDCGGSVPLPDPEAYFRAFLRKSLERREEFTKVWLDMGPPQVGREERIFKAVPVKAAN